MLPSSLRLTVLLVGAGVAFFTVHPSGPPPSIRIDAGARRLVPGEPVRVTVETAEPVARLDGSFLGRPLHFLPDESGKTRRWLAWAVIELDRREGTALLEVTAFEPDGGTSRASRSIRIGSRQFPTQVLDVEPKFVTPPAEVQERIERERARLAAIYETASARVPPAGPFVRPVPGAPTSSFGARRIFNGVRRDPHPGLDLRAATGTTVLASGPGRVVLASELYYSGGTVILDHGGGLFTLYGHLSRIDVHEGEELAAGSAVGRSGATGRVTGPHLHWGAKVGAIPFDPRALLDRRVFP